MDSDRSSCDEDSLLKITATAEENNVKTVDHNYYSLSASDSDDEPLCKYVKREAQVTPKNKDVTVIVENMSEENTCVLLPLFMDIIYQEPEVGLSTDIEIEIETPLMEKSATPPESDIESLTSFGAEESSYSSEPVVKKHPRISRRRSRNPEVWRKNIRKRRRNSGLEYISTSGKLVARKTIKRPECKCKFGCRQNVSENDQRILFNEYWTGDYGKQRDYIRSCIITIPKKRTTTTSTSKRKLTNEYYFTIGEKKVKVCKSFFMGTLAIKEKTISYTTNRTDTIRCEDSRGHQKHKPIKININDKNFIREHISKFPVVESHYCRKNSQRKYLEKNLSIRKMYNLYEKKCVQENKQAQKFWIYDFIFSTEFNYGFHKPKKDLCQMCDSYSKLPATEQEAKRNEHENHLVRKNEARQSKEEDKLRAINDDKIKVLNFDLQKVLITPKLDVCDAYYCRKLATYNLSIYDIASRQATCNMWYETEAKRGSCEIATCLLKYNRSIGAADELVYYSDSCTGQQRNLQFSLMCLYSVITLPIHKITHNYFERGHSQMEGDSIHALIEKTTKNSEIYTPGDWYLAVKQSKIKNPRYKLVELLNEDVLDFKECAKNVVSNRHKDDDGNILKWNSVHSFQYRKDSPNQIFYKYCLRDNFKSLTITRRNSKSKSLQGYQLRSLYKDKLPITDAKYKDLISLCRKNVIPRVHHAFYQSLPYNKSSTDKLPEPDVSDGSESD